MDFFALKVDGSDVNLMRFLIGGVSICKRAMDLIISVYSH